MIRPRQTITKRILKPTQPSLPIKPNLDGKVPVFLEPSPGNLLENYQYREGDIIQSHPAARSHAPEKIQTREFHDDANDPKSSVPQPDSNAQYPDELFRNGHGYVPGPIYSEATHPHSKDRAGGETDKMRKGWSKHLEKIEKAPTHESVPPLEKVPKSDDVDKGDHEKPAKSNFEKVLGSSAASVPPGDKHETHPDTHKKDGPAKEKQEPAIPDYLM